MTVSEEFFRELMVAWVRHRTVGPDPEPEDDDPEPVGGQEAVDIPELGEIKTQIPSLRQVWRPSGRNRSVGGQES